MVQLICLNFLSTLRCHSFASYNLDSFELLMLSHRFICIEFAFPIPMFAPLLLVGRSSWYKELYWVIYNTPSSSPVLAQGLCWIVYFLRIYWRNSILFLLSVVLSANLSILEPYGRYSYPCGSSLCFLSYLYPFFSITHILQKSEFIGDLST